MIALATHTEEKASLFSFSLNIDQVESLLWILAEWGGQPATRKEAVSPEKFNDLVQTLVSQTRGSL
ncbi:hypothetical protein EBX31_11655 [bacterium]|jgi:hypothetical protein|nr:hypothetical protein [bacterium]